eukprot:1535983-Pleurochrysis_carterae.AAC.1
MEVDCCDNRKLLNTKADDFADSNGTMHVPLVLDESPSIAPRRGGYAADLSVSPGLHVVIYTHR